jgi:hypothetical protein
MVAIRQVDFLKAYFLRILFPNYTKIMPTKKVIKKAIEPTHNKVSGIEAVHLPVHSFVSFRFVEEF